MAGAARSPAQPQEWLPSGFPPRSFPPGGAPLSPEAPVGPPPRRGRGVWLAAGAVAVALLLLLGGLLLAGRDDDSGPQVSAGTSTSLEDTSLPTFEATTTAAPAPPASIDPVSTTAAGVTTTVSGTSGGGVLEPSLMTLALPKANATAGPSQGALVLRNGGTAALSFTSQSSSPALTVVPTQGTIGVGAALTLTVTLDATKIAAEGPFNGTLTFGGTGGTRTVEVKSVVGRPPEVIDNAGEACAAPSSTCSRLINVAPPDTATSSPCNTPWLYSVTIKDQSRLQSAKVIARRGLANADVSLRRAGDTDIYLSDPYPPLPAGTVLRFAVEAVDEHGFGRRTADHTITCP